MSPVILDQAGEATYDYPAGTLLEESRRLLRENPYQVGLVDKARGRV
jgi:hypothetical protein